MLPSTSCRSSGARIAGCCNALFGSAFHCKWCRIIAIDRTNFFAKGHTSFHFYKPGSPILSPAFCCRTINALTKEWVAEQRSQKSARTIEFPGRSRQPTQATWSLKPSRFLFLGANGVTYKLCRSFSGAGTRASNAIWIVSVKHCEAPVYVREPPPHFRANHSNRRQFRADAYIVNSGYRTRYPHVAVATDCPADGEGGCP